MRHDGRRPDELRPLKFQRRFTRTPAGSVLVRMGRTTVLCTCSIELAVPPFLVGSGKGWLSAEYSMLPGSTQSRKARDRTGKVDGRSVEIQRLIGRSLRAVVDLEKLGEHTLWIDCDVLEADGGTRTASITGAYVAFALACRQLLRSGKIERSPVVGEVAAVSVGIVQATPLLDLKYDEDSRAEVDMNIVCTSDGRFIEVQGTAEGKPFTREEMDGLLALASHGIAQLVLLQRAAIEQAGS